MKTVNWISCLILISGFLCLSPASAITLGFSPSSDTVNVGESFSVDVVVSGLDAAGEIVSAFDLDVLYDATTLSATGVQYSGNLGIVDVDTFSNTILSIGLVDILESSILSESELSALQSNDVTLATLSFDSLAQGVSSLTFDPDPLFGNSIVGADFFTSLTLETVNQSQVTVLAQIPEPSTSLLLVAGLFAVGMKKLRLTKI